MTKEVFNTEQFEKDSLTAFEKLLQAYRKAKQSKVWESDMDKLVEKLIHLPTDPFLVSLMKLFDYDFLVQSDEINNIIDKSLEIREQMKHSQRLVTINEEYFSIPFLAKNTYLKRLKILNHENELCYQSLGKLRLNIGKFLKCFANKKISLSDIVYFKQKSIQYKELEIYFYSEFIDCTTTDPKDYYDFFCDYYSKILFIQYFTNKENGIPIIKAKANANLLSNVMNLTKSQQVLWSYFFFRLIGLKLRFNLELATLTRFIHSINKMELDNYRNSYVHKLVMKAPYVKSDRNLLPDLELVKALFKNNNLPSDEIENEIEKLSSK
jgi:hypothetical protein